MGNATDLLVALSNSDLGLTDEDLSLVLDFADAHTEHIALSKGLLERSPGKNDNWVESMGGLPPYIEEIANSLHTKQGMTISRAIATAVSRVKKWAAGGDGVKPDTVAKAQKALAQWTALKAKATAKRAAK